MKKFSILIALFLLSLPIFAQTYPSPGPAVAVGTAGLQGWQFVQDWQNPNTCSATTSCSHNAIVPTTSGSVWVLSVITVSGSGTDVPSSITSSGGGTWASCAACQITGGGETATVWYNFTGAAGTTTIAANFGQSETSVFTEFVELTPPAGFTASFDTGGFAVDGACTASCTGTGLTLTSNDAIFSFNINIPGDLADYFVYTGGTNSPWLGDVVGNGVCLNCTSGTAPTVHIVSGTGLVTNAIAFKSSAGNFRPFTPVFNIANISASWTAGQSTHYNCSPTCTYPVASTTSGNLLFIEASNEDATYIYSISGGGTWVIPTACRQVIPAQNNLTLSCAYVLAATSGTTSLSITMTGNATDNGFTVFEVHRTSGLFVLDDVRSTLNAASFNPNGQPLTTTGSIEVLFNAFANDGAVSQCTYYPWYHLDAGGQYGNEFLWEQSTVFALLNSHLDVTPVCWNPQNNASIVNGAAFK